MSEENVEVARAAYEAWNEGDMDALRELFHPDIVVRTPEGWPERGPFVGREAVMRECHRLRAAWDSDALEPISDFVGVADRVLVRQVWRGVGRGPRANIETTNVFTLRDCKVIHTEFFWDHADALEAAGLSE